MKKIIEKWYFSTFIVPFILTYLTNYLTLPKIFENWKNSIIISLIIIIFILIYELLGMKKIIDDQRKRPLEIDKKIIADLIDTLDLDVFQKDIYEQNAWYGYEKSAIMKLSIFIDEAKLLKNKIINKELDRLLMEFLDKVVVFHEFSSMKLYGHNNFSNQIKIRKKQN